ncbi:hypothetical protein D049_0015A, partial [Vibrio parahaemolyticus VPTS-2010]
MLFVDQLVSFIP